MLDDLESFAYSPWLYLLVGVLSALDAVMPPVPSDELVTAISSLAASSGTNRLLLIAPCAALGAWLGDMFSYSIGRMFGPAVIRQLERNPRAARSYSWVRRVIDSYGWLLIFAARYVPFGRFTTMLSCGALRYPFAKFASLDAVSAAISVALWVSVGYFGGSVFLDTPLVGVAVALGMSVVAGVLGRIVLHKITKDDVLVDADGVPILDAIPELAEAVAAAVTDNADLTNDDGPTKDDGTDPTEQHPVLNVGPDGTSKSLAFNVPPDRR